MSILLELVSVSPKYRWRFEFKDRLYEISVNKTFWELQESDVKFAYHHSENSSLSQLRNCNDLFIDKRVDLYEVRHKEAELTIRKVYDHQYFLASYRSINAALTAAKRLRNMDIRNGIS